MTTFEKLRIYHASLAVVGILAYLTGEMGRIHDWLGYGLAGIIALRLAWAVVGPRHIGISRLVPTIPEVAAIRWFAHPAVGKILLSGIIVSLLVATATGFAFDSPGSAERANLNLPTIVTAARADEGGEHGAYGMDHGWLKELHEGSSNLMLLFVALHLVYIFAFRTRLGLFMTFLDRPKEKKPAKA